MEHPEFKRLFIAILLPLEVREEVSRCQHELKKLSPKHVVFPKPENVHLTLKFLGNTDELLIPKIVDALHEIVFSPLDLKLSDLGKFPKEGNVARVLWISVVGEGLHDLIAKIDASLVGLFPNQKVPVIPHLTLLRFKYARPQKKFLEKTKNIVPGQVEFRIQEFALIESQLSHAGPMYKILWSFCGSAQPP